MGEISCDYQKLINFLECRPLSSNPILPTIKSIVKCEMSNFSLILRHYQYFDKTSLNRQNCHFRRYMFKPYILIAVNKFHLLLVSAVLI